MTSDSTRQKSVRRSFWPGILVVLLAAASTVAIFLWARSSIAMPACREAALSEGKELAGYRPIRFFHGSSVAPDGECLLQGADGQIVERSLARRLSGFANFTSFALHYDLVFLGSFVAWGLIVAAATRRRA